MMSPTTSNSGNSSHGSANSLTAESCVSVVFAQVVKKVTISGQMGALNTAGKVTFSPDDSFYLEYADVSG